MNRRDLQGLSRVRLKEARLLLQARLFSGAYYLAGYSVECALKACIAKNSQRFDFPDKQRAQDSFTHDLTKLHRVALLEEEFKSAGIADPALRKHWLTVCTWSEASRYRVHPQSDAEDMMEAVSQKGHGVLPWLIQR